MHGLYKDILLDHYRYPRNQGVLAGANCVSVQHNPSCGDTVAMTASIEQGQMVELRFEARGCVICVAAASLLSEQLRGCTIAELQAFDAQMVLVLLGTSLGPTRLKCALLALYAVQDGLKNYTKTIDAQ